MRVLTPNIKLNVRSVGRAWPAGHPVTNLDLLKSHSETHDKDPEFLNQLDMRIRRGFGFNQRYLSRFPGSSIVSKTEETSESLAFASVKRALKSIPLNSIESFVLGSTTTCRYTGSQATSILGRMGLEVPAYEIKAGCSTSLASLHFAQALLLQGYKNVLVSCAETLSKVINPKVRETWFGLADGAAALLLESAPNQGQIEILKSFYSTDGKYVDLYTTKGSLPPHQEALEQGGYYLSGDSAQLKEIAKSKYLKMIEALLPSSQERKEVNWIIPHQVNRLLIEEVCKETEVFGKLLWSAEEFGNLGGASVLFTLAEAIEKRVFQKGDQVLMMSVGGGLSFAAQLWRIHDPIEISPIF